MRRTSPGENTNDLSAMLALVDASSAQVDERLAVELALRYETWAPGQLAVVVGAIERQRVHLAEASTLYPGLDLSSDGELAHVRSTLLTNTELPVLDRSRWIALSNQWSDGLTTAIDEHAAAVAKNASLASRTARRSFQVTAIAGVAILLGAVALAALVARRRIQELADLEYRADYDALTGLANRSRSIREIEALCRNASSDARPALLFLDLDGFKAINDRYGHERGDQTLREVANRLRRAADDEVVIGRLGGDEFVAALPDARSREAVLDLATRLRAAILEAPTRAEISFDVSIGAAIHEPEQSYLDVLAAADAAMYAAKGTTQRFRFASHERADDQAPLQRQPATARAPQRSYELTR